MTGFELTMVLLFNTYLFLFPLFFFRFDIITLNNLALGMHSDTSTSYIWHEHNRIPPSQQTNTEHNAYANTSINTGSTRPTGRLRTGCLQQYGHCDVRPSGDHSLFGRRRATTDRHLVARPHDARDSQQAPPDGQGLLVDAGQCVAVRFGRVHMSGVHGCRQAGHADTDVAGLRSDAHEPAVRPAVLALCGEQATGADYHDDTGAS